MKHITRSLKYLVKLLLLVVGIYAVMYATDTLGTSMDELLGAKGIVLVVALVAVAAAYPTYGFISRTTKASFVRDKGDIIEVMHREGYALANQSEEELVFRSARPLTRLWAMGDDKVVVRPEGDEMISILGKRKVVVEAAFRIESITMGK